MIEKIATIALTVIEKIATEKDQKQNQNLGLKIGIAEIEKVIRFIKIKNKLREEKKTNVKDLDHVVEKTINQSQSIERKKTCVHLVIIKKDRIKILRSKKVLNMKEKIRNQRTLDHQ